MVYSPRRIFWLGGGTGIRARLKIVYPQGCVGSIPTRATRKENSDLSELFFSLGMELNPCEAQRVRARDRFTNLLSSIVRRVKGPCSSPEGIP